MTRLYPVGVDLVSVQEPSNSASVVEPPGGFAKYSLVFVIDKREDKVGDASEAEGVMAGRVSMNGFGGKLEPGEDIAECAIRETWEECGLRIAPKDLHYVGEMLVVRLGSKGTWKPEQLVIYFYVAYKWEGEPIETDEMDPSWIPLSEIPYDRMHPEQAIYLPQILGPRAEKETFVARLECDEVDNLGWWMGWVPRE